MTRETTLVCPKCPYEQPAKVGEAKKCPACGAKLRPTLNLELTGRGHAVRLRVQDGSELDRLFLKGIIDEFQHSAGEQFSRDLHRAKMLGMATTNFARNGSGGGSITDAQADALGRVGDAIRYIEHEVGPSVRMVTLNACLSLCVTVQVEELRAGLAALLDCYDARSSALSVTPLV